MTGYCPSDTTLSGLLLAVKSHISPGRSHPRLAIRNLGGFVTRDVGRSARTTNSAATGIRSLGDVSNGALRRLARLYRRTSPMSEPLPWRS